ncbi:CRISPR-associated endonuclease Cas2 [Caldifermentibacillus hisashii]|uniref:CRISPR-associated endonuclease Cas2 n=1 Tax=Caldifermentibacillus hisashii TaxID=996558 RepID=UPI002E1C3BC9|nr:CRISPR-associated endonuclease Cas2 [Caldifermentibacillus hisashii]MED3641848.1 CRISPR-associated endonuclease Cas2 [Caldifermentibacillus hisashii]
MVLFFDLPMNTKEERRIYYKFRKFLVSNGFVMLQFSVYVKIFPNRISLFQYIEGLKRNLPSKGNIRIMAVTEKQYEKMLLLVGGKSIQEETINELPMVIL